MYYIYASTAAELRKVTGKEEMGGITSTDVTTRRGCDISGCISAPERQRLNALALDMVKGDFAVFESLPITSHDEKGNNEGISAMHNVP